VLVYNFHYWSSASLIMGGKDGVLNAYTKCIPRGTVNLWGDFSKPLKYIFFCSVCISLTFLNINCFVAKLCESGGQPRPTNWKITIKLRSALKIIPKKNLKHYLLAFQIKNICISNVNYWRVYWSWYSHFTSTCVPYLWRHHWCGLCMAGQQLV
jgi:hypothetical protein